MVLILVVIDVNFGSPVGTDNVADDLCMHTGRIAVPAYVQAGGGRQNSSIEGAAAVSPPFDHLGIVGGKTRAWGVP